MHVYSGSDLRAGWRRAFFSLPCPVMLKFKSAAAKVSEP